MEVSWQAVCLLTAARASRGVPTGIAPLSWQRANDLPVKKPGN
jgi:hypothetical protein